ncbi:MAG TPA: stage II sporulation protein M [Vicinamibacterales bacterium]|nr:stage II sporulation protein M [Vicinamibacterales bacterium]
MTPLHFEQLYQKEWDELERLLDLAAGRKAGTTDSGSAVSGARLAALYRRACEHLALARARSYPAYMVDRLERATANAHQLIYHRRELGLAQLKNLIARDFPRAVRANWPYVATAAAVFLLPTIVIGVLVYWRPDLILSVVSSDTASSFEDMYSPNARSIGRIRTASTDWMMFGFYIRNNISVAFQCYAGGLFAGLGTLFFLAYNGAFGGALAGFLTARGLSATFYSFVATHSAFELTAIVLAGAAGLRIGHALLAPGRVTRRQSLVYAARGSVVLLYGVSAMLCVAAAVEAFWSSASWLAPSIKYGVAAVCWTAVLSYFTFQGRRAD